MIVNASINYTASGRKRKVVATKRVSHRSSTTKAALQPSVEHPRQRITEYPSAPMTKYVSPEDQSFKREVSKNYTIAIAYNKGAYQVIPRNSVKDIGK